jgi:hypothetical protein
VNSFQFTRSARLILALRRSAEGRAPPHYQLRLCLRIIATGHHTSACPPPIARAAPPNLPRDRSIRRLAT